MDGSFLATKLHFPLPRQAIVSRPRLVEHLHQGMKNSLTLISGSAGSGKTTLLGEWREHLGREFHLGWLSLDEGDNDIHVFFTYLLAALDRIQPDLTVSIKPLLEPSISPRPEIILTALLNTLSTLKDDSVLVLDDYHVIANPEIQAAMSFLVENLPHQMHLVILTRIDPPLPLARWRSRGKLVELRDKDLCFNFDEAAVFLKQVMQLSITDEQVRALETRSEGWIAGLQMAALSMRGRQDPGSFVSTFTGSHRFVIDYLTDEVLSQQTQEVRRFLLKTSLLDYLFDSLCEAVAGGSDGQAMLEHLEAANLFIIPLDEERKWYRYHHLFADLLRNRLRQVFPGEVGDLHRKASQWYEEHEFIENALQHAADIPDLQLVEDILTRHAISMIDHGYTRLVYHWLNTLSHEVLTSNPTLAMSMSICALIIPPRDLERSQEWLQHAESSLAKLPAAPETTTGLRENIAVYRINLARMADEKPEHILELIASMRANFPNASPRRMAFIYFNEAEAYLTLHNLDAAEKAFERIQSLGPMVENPYDRQIGLSKQIDLYARRGLVHQAEQLCIRNLIVEDTSASIEKVVDPVNGLIDISYGEILLYKCDLERAKDYLERGNRRLAMTAEIAVQGRALIDLTRIALWQGKLNEAGKLIEIISPLQLPFTESVNLLYWLHQSIYDHNALGEVKRCLDENPILPDAQSDIPGVLLREERRFYDQLVQACAAIALFSGKYISDLDAVVAFLDAQIAYAKKHGWKIRLIQLLATRALALRALGEQEQSLQAAGEALRQSGSSDVLGLFIDFGQYFLNLIKPMLSSQPVLRPVIARILALAPGGAEPSLQSVKTDGLIEPLTEREQDVLRLIAAGLTNPEIAQELYLTLNTIKTHTRGIYGKLGVNNRTQATVRARDLGLV